MAPRPFIHPSLEDLRIHFGQALQDMRVQAGLTQAQVAASSGLTQPHIYEIESAQHNFTIGTIFRLAKALGKDVRLELVDRPTQRRDVST